MALILTLRRSVLKSNSFLYLSNDTLPNSFELFKAKSNKYSQGGLVLTETWQHNEQAGMTLTKKYVPQIIYYLSPDILIKINNPMDYVRTHYKSKLLILYTLLTPMSSNSELLYGIRENHNLYGSQQ